MPEAADEFFRCHGQGVFGIDPAFSGKIDKSKENVAEFLADCCLVLLRFGLTEFLDFLLDLCQNIFGICPVKTDASGFLLESHGTRQ
ncbi:MAG: hypothetical protein BWY77_01995 [bacterium ADurb.Bin431]|nr:MAG: hypothetical protein BWY77_01995 [bacterium ADurb.Bin431]